MTEEVNNHENDLELNTIHESIDEIEEQIATLDFEPIPVDIGRGLQMRVYIEDCWDAVIACNNHHAHPTLFQKSGSLVRIAKSGDGRIIQPLDMGKMNNALIYRINFCRTPTHKEVQKYIDEHPLQENAALAAMAPISMKPPQEIVSAILHRQNYEGLPELIGLVTCPIIDLHTGDINFHSHYNPDAQMYYGRKQGFVIPPIPQNPTVEQRQSAVELLKETIIDFPFVKSVDRINALACIITAVIRPSIPGNIPIYLIDKPAPGTGAGLLCDTISLVVTGEMASVMTIVKNNDEEWKKVITSVLREGNLIAIIDNVEDKVDLASLASLVTCGKYSDRVLATNTMLKSPHKNVWILNGNNVQIGGDLGRRVYMSRMDANLKQPWLRGNFKYNQKVWITEHRGGILSAIYTIVRSWVRAGSIPADCKIPLMGSFEEWRDIIGGIMQHIGYNELMSNTDEMIENTDADTPQWDLFITTLFERMVDWDKKERKMIGSYCSIAATTKEVCFTTANVIDLIEYEKDPYHVGEKIPFIDTFPDVIADGYQNEKNVNRIFARHLRTHVGRIFGKGYRLDKGTIHTNNKVQWKITKLF